jgi:hypothetical protein
MAAVRVCFRVTNYIPLLRRAAASPVQHLTYGRNRGGENGDEGRTVAPIEAASGGSLRVSGEQQYGRHRARPQKIR